jgi:uncharacterized protein YycO
MDLIFSGGEKYLKRIKATFFILTIFLIILVLYTYFSQFIFAHRHELFFPDYEQIDLTPILLKENFTSEDYQTLFFQTGLGPKAIQKLLSDGSSGMESIKSYQEKFFLQNTYSCEPLLGWFTRADTLLDLSGNHIKTPDFVCPQAGDIIITLSTHSMGWHHGHCALVLDDTTTLESHVLFSNSEIGKLSNWRNYSTYILLRVKVTSNDTCEEVADYARNHLSSIPYRLSSGFIGQKDRSSDSFLFGAHCSYLVWYAYQKYGIDLDGNHGRLVTPRDILKSENLEVVQIYGVDPTSIDITNSLK